MPIPLEIIREFHTERSRARILRDAAGGSDETRTDAPRRRRRWSPGTRFGLQRFFPEWPAEGQRAPGGSPA